MSYAGDKNLVTFEGDHNSPRPAFYFVSVGIFLHNCLRGGQSEPPYMPPTYPRLDPVRNSLDSSPMQSGDQSATSKLA